MREGEREDFFSLLLLLQTNFFFAAVALRDSKKKITGREEFPISGQEINTEIRRC